VSNKKRRKIKFCYEDYCRTISDDTREKYNKTFKPLVEIILSAEHDEEILDQAKKYDLVNGTDIFSEAVNFTIYCIACHRVDCVC
jgi:hypothetical protein